MAGRSLFTQHQSYLVFVCMCKEITFAYVKIWDLNRKNAIYVKIRKQEVGTEDVVYVGSKLQLGICMQRVFAFGTRGKEHKHRSTLSNNHKPQQQGSAQPKP